jgi:hypothetical protein
MTGREVPLGEAADLLGLTTEALRQRLKRGKSLRGVKRAGEWYVLLDQSQLDGQPVASSHDQSQPVMNGHDQTRLDAGEVAALREALAAGRDETIYLRGELQRQLERHAEETAAWQERLREAHLLAAQRPALPAAAETPTETPRNDCAGSAESPRSWWARWWPWGRS